MSHTITEAGLAACINEDGTGLAPVTLDHVKVYDKGALKAEIPLQGVEVIEPSRIYVAAEDASNNEFDGREFRFYTTENVWFSTVKLNNNAIIQSKGRSSVFLLGWELTLSQKPGSVAPSGNVTFLNPYATPELRGVVKFATPEEALNGQGSDTAQPKAMTPENVREHGDNRYFQLNVTTRLLFASWPLPQGWTLDTSGGDRVAMITNKPSQINTTGGDWTITGMQSAGSHKHGITILGHALTAEENGPHQHTKERQTVGGALNHGGWRGDYLPWGDSQGGVYSASSGLSGSGKPHAHGADMKDGGGHVHDHDGKWRPAYRQFALGVYQP